MTVSSGNKGKYGKIVSVYNGTRFIFNKDYIKIGMKKRLKKLPLEYKYEVHFNGHGYYGLYINGVLRWSIRDEYKSWF